MKTPLHQKKFTLVEILITLLVLAIVSGTALTGLQLSMRNSAQNTDYIMATGLLEKIMAELRRDIIGSESFKLIGDELQSGTVIGKQLFFTRDGLPAASLATSDFNANFNLSLIDSHSNLIPLYPTLFNAAPGGGLDYETLPVSAPASFPAYGGGLTKGLIKVQLVLNDNLQRFQIETAELFHRRDF